MNKRAQSIIEYAVVLGIVVTALTAMQLYFKRGINTVIKTAADEVGTQEGSSVEVNSDNVPNSTANTTNVSTNRSVVQSGGAVTNTVDSIGNVVSNGTDFSRTKNNISQNSGPGSGYGTESVSTGDTIPPDDPADSVDDTGDGE